MAWGFEKMPIWESTISRLGPEDTQANFHPSTSSPGQNLKIHYDQVKSFLRKSQKSSEQLMKFLPTSPFWFLSHNSSNRKGEGAYVVVNSDFSLESRVPPHQDCHKWRSRSPYQASHSTPRRERLRALPDITLATRRETLGLAPSSYSTPRKGPHIFPL